MYYLEPSTEAQPNSYVIWATYDEGKAMTAAPNSAYAWYQPYGNAPIPVMDDDIEQLINDVPVNDGCYRNVFLAAKWHIKHKKPILAPGSKETIRCAGLPPYGTREVYWEIVRKHPKTTPIGEAVAVLKHHRKSNPTYMEAEEYYTQLELDQEQTALQSIYGEIRNRLAPMLAPNGCTNGLPGTIAAALPANLPPPFASSMNYPDTPGISHSEWERLTWQWRMMYVLCMGIALGEL